MNEPLIPDKATIEYGRRTIGALRDKLKDWEQKAAREGNEDRQRRCRYAGMMIDRELLGGEGCVIAAFDERWLDDEFRQVMGEARERAMKSPKKGKSWRASNSQD